MRKILPALLLFVGPLFAIQSAKADDSCATAQNLVTNCGFETGDFTGWSGTALTASNIINGYVGVDGSDAFSGDDEAFLGGFPTDETLTQNIATTAGTTYTVSFYVDNDGSASAGYGNDFSATFGGTTLATFTNAAAFSYVLETAQITATSSSTALTFTSSNDNYYFDLDTISVTANAVTAPTPEPSSLVLLGSGLAGLAGVARRRFRKA